MLLIPPTGTGQRAAKTVLVYLRNCHSPAKPCQIRLGENIIGKNENK